MKKEPKVRVLVADDHYVVRMGVIAIINNEPDMEVVAEAANGEQALELFKKHKPEVRYVSTDVSEYACERMVGRSVRVAACQSRTSRRSSRCRTPASRAPGPASPSFQNDPRRRNTSPAEPATG